METSFVYEQLLAACLHRLNSKNVLEKETIWDNIQTDLGTKSLRLLLGRERTRYKVYNSRASIQITKRRCC